VAVTDESGIISRIKRGKGLLRQKVDILAAKLAKWKLQDVDVLKSFAVGGSSQRITVFAAFRYQGQQHTCRDCEEAS